MSRWLRGPVDPASEHIELLHGNVDDDLVKVARIAPTATGHTFIVDFLEPEKLADQVIADVRDELDFYLVEKEEPDRWTYAKYHCSTAANLYGEVHWALHVDEGGEGATDPVCRFVTETAGCTQCHEAGLLDSRAHPLFQRWPGCTSGVLVVAEAPNLDDTVDPAKGYLTYDITTDPTGNFARELFESVGLNTYDIAFTNSVLCLPKEKGGRYPVTAELKNTCQKWLRRMIQLVDPKVVVTFGGEPLDATNRLEHHGLKLQDAGKLREWFGRKLLPLYHPGRLGRVARSAEEQKGDIAALRTAVGVTP